MIVADVFVDENEHYLTRLSRRSCAARNATAKSTRELFQENY